MLILIYLFDHIIFHKQFGGQGKTAMFTTSSNLTSGSNLKKGNHLLERFKNQNKKTQSIYGIEKLFKSYFLLWIFCF